MAQGLDDVKLAPGLRYRAFLSYRSSDRRQAEWLQRSIERYRVPRDLVGTVGERGEISGYPGECTVIVRKAGPKKTSKRPSETS